MKDRMIDWVEEHKYEHEDGTWSRMGSDGEPVGTHYATEAELDKVLWDYIVANADELMMAP